MTHFRIRAWWADEPTNQTNKSQHMCSDEWTINFYSSVRIHPGTAIFTKFHFISLPPTLSLSISPCRVVHQLGKQLVIAAEGKCWIWCCCRCCRSGKVVCISLQTITGAVQLYLHHNLRFYSSRHSSSVAGDNLYFQRGDSGQCNWIRVATSTI